VDRFKREDGGSTPHLNVRVLDETGQPWRIAVNAQLDNARTGMEITRSLEEEAAPTAPCLTLRHRHDGIEWT
jgi:hypothetical protein